MALKFPIFMDAQSTTPVRSAGRRGDAAVLHREVRQPGQPQPPLRLGGRGGGRRRARARSPQLIGAAIPRRSSSPPARPSRSTSRIKGVAEMYRRRATTSSPPPSSTRPCSTSCKRLERQGFEVTYVPVRPDGLIDAERDPQARSPTRRSSSRSCSPTTRSARSSDDRRDRQAAPRRRASSSTPTPRRPSGKIAVDVEAMDIDLLSLHGAHDLRAQGRRRALRAAQGRRACAWRRRWTAAATSAACARARSTVPRHRRLRQGRARSAGRRWREETRAARELRDRLQDMILSSSTRSYLNGHPERRLPDNLNISFAYVEGESVLMGLNKDIGALVGLGLHLGHASSRRYVLGRWASSAELAHSSIRFGLSRFNTEEEVDYVGRARSIERGQAAARHVAALRDGARKAST